MISAERSKLQDNESHGKDVIDQLPTGAKVAARRSLRLQKRRIKSINQPPLTYERIIERFLTWAKTQQDLRAAITLGSRARLDPPADASSDLDLALITTDPERYLGDAGWLEHIGTPWLTFVERQATGTGLERRALFERDLDVDFAIVEYEEFQKMLAGDWPPEVPAVLARGFEFILDKDGLETPLRREIPKPPRAHLPTSDEFVSLCSDFLYHAMWAAKKLRRGEIWVAKSCTDCYMKQQLLQMLTRQALARHGPGYDTWHKGRFLES